MLNKVQAIVELKKFIPGTPIKACADYKDLYLFRVEHPSPLEKDWDPFYSVNKKTGEAREYSILTDGNIIEISKLEWVEL